MIILLHKKVSTLCDHIIRYFAQNQKTENLSAFQSGATQLQDKIEKFRKSSE